MDTQSATRDALLDAIIEMELVMFVATPNEGGPASCQQKPEAFRMMRWMAHCIHDEATLLSYYNDLQAAQINERNLMVEKYARMDNRIPPVSTSPLVDHIAEAESSWLEAAVNLYPHALKGNGKQVFKHYISCELETLSDETLEHYANEVNIALQNNKNLVIDRHDMLCKRLGYESLAAREAQLAAQTQGESA
ncbi:MAG: DUF4125 family protein [Desulfovibrionaceae bacterium]